MDRISLFAAGWSAVAASLVFIGNPILADTLTSQVRIDVKIVEVSRNSTRELGIDNSLAEALSKLPPDASKLPAPQTSVPVLGPSPSAGVIGQRLFPNEEAPYNITFSTMLTDPQLEAMLKAFDRAKNAKVLSVPTVMAPYNQRASIVINPSVPFPNQTLILDATPHLGADGSILITIVPKVSEGNILQQPTVQPREVANPITVGIDQVPVLGGLFKKTQTPEHKENLIVFVTAQPVDVFSHSSSGNGSDPVKVDAVGTGETIGHVGDLNIQNLTDGPLHFFVPPMILESINGSDQDYVCPHGENVSIPAGQTKTVPMDGVCINRNKPPVGKGVSGALVVNTVEPNIAQHPDCHLPAKAAGNLLLICDSIYQAAEKLQEEGELKEFPYKKKKEQKEILVQWSTWANPRISEVTKEPPATKDDLKKVVYKQVEEKGKPSPGTKKKLDQGIDTIFEKVELTSTKAKELEKPDPFAGVELTGEKAKNEQEPAAQSPAPSPKG